MTPKKKWYYREMEFDNSEFNELKGMFKKQKIDDCFKCEEDIKI